jgi:CheY-like chemotaxis protein
MANRQRILIIDDEQDILEIYQEILSRLQSKPDILTVDNGSQGIAMLESQTFNLLLIDLLMPQMDGFQVLAIVRRKFPALRVVVMTNSDDEQFRQRAYAMGVDLFLQKPKTGKEIINFVDCIESLLEREEMGGFRGVQSKTLVDLIQLECLTQSSAILKITTGRAMDASGFNAETHRCGYWGALRQGSTDRNARWKTGNFEFCPTTSRDRALCLQVGKHLNGIGAVARRKLATAEQAPAAEDAGLTSFRSLQGVQFAVALRRPIRKSFDQWGSEIPINGRIRQRYRHASMRKLSDVLEADRSRKSRLWGHSATLAILVGDEESLGVGFTRSATLVHIRETMKSIEAKWAS